MHGSYEKSRICDYLSNLIGVTSHRSPVAEAIIKWINDEGTWLGVEINTDADRIPPRKRKRLRRRKSPVSKRDWKYIQSAVVSYQKRHGKPEQLNTFDRNIRLISSHFNLTNIEGELLDIVCRYCNRGLIEDLIDHILDTGSIDADQLLSHMMDVDYVEIVKCLKSSSNIRSSGLLAIGSISSSSYFIRTDFTYKVPKGLQQALMPPNTTLDEITSCLVKKSDHSELKWDDFNHIAKERDFIYDVLKGITSEKTKGINILLYGPPGTGKTEFCHVMANRLKQDLFVIQEEDEEGHEPARNDRLLGVKFSGRLLEKKKNSILLFDEMEDLLDQSISFFGMRLGNGKSGSKVFINRLLENNNVPTFWTCNDIQGFDPSMLRRMTIAVELKIPSYKIRKNVWNRILNKYDFKLPNDDIANLAKELKAAPALAESAVKATRLAHGGKKEMRMAVRLASKAIRGGKSLPPVNGNFSSFNENLSNIDLDCQTLTEQIVDHGEKQFSLCLYGPPGTGKSAYARHLANQLGMDVVFKKASDLKSKWVGESEKNMAGAFDEALSNESLLIFDEADSLLQDRSRAHHSWEVSQVNEMLTWMESHPLPFICTTNFMDSLDKASLRRFTFKIEFHYLEPDQIADAFEYFFALKAPDEARNFQVLTPGDFAVVANKARILGCQRDVNALTKLLFEECHAKPDMPKQMGFV